MKKLIVLLLFIPLVSFSQVTYDDIMKLDSRDAFIKFMFDAQFSFLPSHSSGDDLAYALNPTEMDSSYPSSSHFANWFEDDFFIFSFERSDAKVNENNYNTILKKVKSRCKFIEMRKITNSYYGCYECDDAKFKSKILGFTIDGNRGEIIQM